MRQRSLEENTLAVSFLDLLSCGMGASVLLFLVFSTVNRGKIDSADASKPGRAAASWHADGAPAPVEVIVRFREPLNVRRFCWAGIDQPNTIADRACPPTEPGANESPVRTDFFVIFPDGLPNHAFGVRILGGAPVDPTGVTVHARQAGEERTYVPRFAPTDTGDVRFWLDPRHWPSARQP